MQSGTRPRLLAWLDPRLIFPIVLGVLVALGCYKLWDYHWRWMVMTAGGVVGLAAAMVGIGHVGRLGIYVFLFAIPVASIEKWFFLDRVYSDWVADQLWSGFIGLGPIDLIIAFLWLSWIFRVFVTKESPLPRLEGLDFLVLLLLATYCLSLMGAPNVTVGIFSTVFLLKHLAAYFYVSRHLTKEHLRWVVVAVMVSIAIQASLAVLQTQFHVLEGFARHKGANIEEVGTQATVPGLEDFKRAEGSLLDSHSYGIYLAMLLTFPFILMQDDSQKPKVQLLYLGLFIAGSLGVLLSFSRSAWIGFAASIPWAFVLMARAGHPRVLRSVLISVGVGLLLAPLAVSYMLLRFAHAPAELIENRFEGYDATIPMIQEHWFLGVGVGNYLDALRIYSYNWAPEIVVHNVLMFVWSESGIVGVIAWYGIMVAVGLRCLKITRRGKGLVKQLGYCPLIAFFAYCVDGLAEPTYREPVVFMNYWFMVALTFALTKIMKKEEKKESTALTQP